jgi:hypothetical protein
MSTSKLWMACSAGIGAVAAIATAAIMNRVEARAEIAPRPKQVQTAPQDKVTHYETIIVPGEPRRLDELEQQVAQLQNDQETRRLAQAGAAPPNPEEERRQLEQRFGDLERRLAADPIDPSWSRQATGRLQTDLTSAGTTLGFSVVAAECRTEMCRARLQWNDYGAAVKTGLGLPERAIPGLNCVKSIWLKEPQPGGSSYSADLYLDCTEQRTGQVATIPTMQGDVP